MVSKTRESQTGLQICRFGSFNLNGTARAPTEADTNGLPDPEKWEAGVKERERGHTSPAAGVPPKPGWHRGQEARADGVCVWGGLGLENSPSMSTTLSLAQVLCSWRHGDRTCSTLGMDLFLPQSLRVANHFSSTHLASLSVNRRQLMPSVLVHLCYQA